MSKDNIAFIFGSGALIDGWKPVIKAIQRANPNVKNAETSNLYLAKIIYLLRSYSNNSGRHKEVDYIKHLKFFDLLRMYICRCLKNAEENEELKPRNELDSIVEKFLPIENNNFIVSTNWDTVVDRAILKNFQKLRSNPDFKAKIYHLHGDISDYKSLYLPSEIVQEKYRSIEEQKRMEEIAGRIAITISTCQVSVVYGLSFNSLDAELVQYIGESWNKGATRTIKIINPEHGDVAQRIKVLLNKKKIINIVGFHPNDLDTPIFY